MSVRGTSVCVCACARLPACGGPGDGETQIQALTCEMFTQAQCKL